MSPEEIKQKLNKIDDMERELRELKSFVSERRRQQLSYPLDINSVDIVRDRVLVFSKEETGTIIADKTLKVVVNGKTYQINVL